MDLDQALHQFDSIEANLTKIERIWAKMRKLIPEGIAFLGAGPEGREYRELARSYAAVLGGLPAIDGWKITSVPLAIDEIAQFRLDASEVGEVDATLSAERAVSEPEHQIEEYRSRFQRKRRLLVRSRLAELVQLIDASLATLRPGSETTTSLLKDRGPDWDRLESYVSEIDRLLGGIGRKRAWIDMGRHIKFAMEQDLRDIRERDWPDVKREIGQLSYDESEPIEVSVADLGHLVASNPRGAVATALNWSVLDPEAFERLIFEVICDTHGYENPEWLMKTNAPDRARDLSVTRVRNDPLSGTIRERMIIQCKHWLAKSVPDTELSSACVKVSHWEPPSVDVLVFVTSGRFTADAVKWQEKHNHAGDHPRIELWPENQIERFLAQRPHIVANYKLR